MIKRFGKSPDAIQRYIPRPGAYAILPRAGKLLVTHQSDPSPEYQLPGGGIDPGEHPIAALHREVLEETGWAISAPRRLGAFRRFVYMPEYALWAEKICHIYLAYPTLQRGQPTEPGHSFHWLTLEEACSNLGNPGDRAFVSRLIR